MRIALIHAVEAAKEQSAPRFESAGFTVINLLDEALLPMAEDHGGVDDACAARMASLIRLAVEADVDAVVVTCNAYSGAVEEIAKQYPALPVLSIDFQLIRQAIFAGPRIGLIGTVAVGLSRQHQLILDTAVQLGRPVEIILRLAPDALAHLRAGDIDGHDRRIAEVAESLSLEVDVVVLAQASMASAADLVAERGLAMAPVLASPQLMARHLTEDRRSQRGS